ncbi:uncharacterized protein BDZ99DRAFT_433035 [Mytilinidion resinicola]|uniref:BTB/POZ domain-containing protein n=1 Tax=Mytilinidion resinicola TaxID=574789 RepID=A0A6A6Z4U7_9PEZI|nr:uncharacterized protein BDZ99DRAFT_433035 [Mytilinidion resinicola]KAF2816096.1 hypothetical protein BDZ99DRAFT_433035 [Mytilinidion resinicola]
MPEQTGFTSSRDFAFQSTDQDFAHGADAATTNTASQSTTRYDPESTTNASNAPSDAHQTAPDALLRGYNQQQSPDAFANYGYSPGGPLVWDWNNSIDFSEFAHHYEPQGELVQELQNQNNPSQDFSIPLPVSVHEPIYQSPLHTPNTATAPTQNPLSPPPPPQQRPTVTTTTASVKRKAPSEPSSATSAGVSSHLPDIQQPAAKRPTKSRSSSSASANAPAIASASSDRRPSTSMASAQTTTVTAGTGEGTSGDVTRRKSDKAVASNSRQSEHVRSRRIVEAPSGRDPSQLPAGKVFPIQIGSELFRLSGASISSDAPSYFSHFFGEQLHHTTGRAGDLRTLYIDRDPVTFRDISLHLQGYHVKPRDPQHFVRLFADAQFYSLPRLTKQLFSMDIFIRVGHRDFQIPRDLFSSPGDSPNYFSLGFAQFFTTPTEVFPGLDRDQLLRPPSITPPAVPSRNGDIFAEVLKLLQGYQVHIRDESHRAELLRDARYFHLKGLEQRLIPCEISFNLARGTSEILIRLEDIRQSGVSFKPDTHAYNIATTSNSSNASPAPGFAPLSKPPTPTPHSTTSSTASSTIGSGTVSYARPYTDEHANTNVLILEIGSQESTRLHFPISPTTSSSSSPSLDLRATFHGQTLARITSLFSVAAAKMGLPATQPLGLMMLQNGGGVAAQPMSPANSGLSENRVRVRWESDAWIEVDGVAVEVTSGENGVLGVQRVKGSSKNTDGDGDETMEELEEEDDEWVWGGARREEEEREWIVKKGHWRLRVEPVDGEIGRMQIVMCPVRIEAMSCERTRNRRRGFLS